MLWYRFVFATLFLTLVGTLPSAAACFDTATKFSSEAVAHYQAIRDQAKGADYDAQYELATLYRDGNGVEQDLVRAWAWLNVAAGGVKAATVERERVGKCLDSTAQMKAQVLSLELLAGVSPR